MKNRFSSLFKGRDSADSATEPIEAPAPPAKPAVSPATGVVDFETVLADLRDFVCSASSQSLSQAEVDAALHMYDAGYVDSITAVDLLIHVESRYGLFISEMELVGLHYSLGALAEHVVASTT